MEAVAVVAVVALLASNTLWLRAYQEREKSTTAERRELLTRITHPDLIPVAESPPDSELLTADVGDEYGLVGEIEASSNGDG
jgi:hypothetical protein